MNRYATMFERCRAAGEGAFGGFVMLGDPGLAESAALLDAMVDGGADMIEVGVPFSDPVADGPTIQAAAMRALAAGVRVGDCFDLIAGFRARHPHIPLGILTYANLLVARGRGRFYRDAAAAGADSLLVADVPSLEAAPWAAEAREAGIAPVMIAAPNTPPPALATIARLGGGYTYCVARTGVTGSGVAPALGHGALFEALQALGAPPPVLGFGIATPAHVRAALAAGAAGVISGSAIVEASREANPAARVATLVAALKAATRG
jgi:tryptophan synthase alpha chain